MNHVAFIDVAPSSIVISQPGLAEVLDGKLNEKAKDELESLFYYVINLKNYFNALERELTPDNYKKVKTSGISLRLYHI